MENTNKEKNVNLDEFLDLENELENTDESVIIKADKSIVEKISKTIITEDGRQLLL